MTVHTERLPYHPMLGRNIAHDPASVAYGLPVAPKSALKTTMWERRVPIFNQKQVGSCTGNASVGKLSYDSAAGQGWVELPDGTHIDELLAVDVYADAEELDGEGHVTVKDLGGDTYSVTPDDGSSGLSVAKVLKTRALISGYQHAFSTDAVYSALMSAPGITGINWYQSMFDTEADGHIKVDLSSGLAGGHEFVIKGVEVAADGTVARVWMDNSWDTSWGVSGGGYFTPAEYKALMAKQGDFTALNPLSVPTPSPSPPPQPPVPDPGGDPLSFLDPVVASRIRRVAGSSVASWLNHHFDSYFHIPK